MALWPPPPPLPLLSSSAQYVIKNSGIVWLDLYTTSTSLSSSPAPAREGLCGPPCTLSYSLGSAVLFMLQSIAPPAYSLLVPHSTLTISSCRCCSLPAPSLCA
jgi:hypothetical protein